MSNARDDEHAGRTVIGPAGIFITRELRRRVRRSSTRAHRSRMVVAQIAAKFALMHLMSRYVQVDREKPVHIDCFRAFGTLRPVQITQKSASVHVLGRFAQVKPLPYAKEHSSELGESHRPAATGECRHRRSWRAHWWAQLRPQPLRLTPRRHTRSRRIRRTHGRGRRSTRRRHLPHRPQRRRTSRRSRRRRRPPAPSGPP